MPMSSLCGLLALVYLMHHKNNKKNNNKKKTVWHMRTVNAYVSSPHNLTRAISVRQCTLQYPLILLAGNIGPD